MKKIADLTMRGKIECASNSSGFTERLQMFDGRFNTAYRVTKFIVSTNAANAGSDCIGKLSAEEPADPADAFWDWSNNTELAWAAFTMDATVTPGEGWATNNNLVDRENLIVQDLFITVRTRDISDPFVNYYIELEKYDMTDAQGALAMVRNRAQG